MVYVSHRSLAFPARDSLPSTIEKLLSRSYFLLLLFYWCPYSFKEMLNQWVVFITEYIPIKDIKLEKTEKRFLKILEKIKGGSNGMTVLKCRGIFAECFCQALSIQSPLIFAMTHGIITTLLDRWWKWGSCDFHWGSCEFCDFPEFTK